MSAMLADEWMWSCAENLAGVDQLMELERGGAGMHAGNADAETGRQKRSGVMMAYMSRNYSVESSSFSRECSLSVFAGMGNHSPNCPQTDHKMTAKNSELGPLDGGSGSYLIARYSTDVWRARRTAGQTGRHSSCTGICKF